MKTMKYILTTIMAMSMFVTVNAQKKKKAKMEYDDETMIVTADGEPYCMMKKHKASSLSFNNDFIFMNLEGEELVMMAYGTRRVWNQETRKYDDKIYYAITFIGEDYKHYRNSKAGSMGEKGAMKEVFRNELIESNALDSLSVVKYCSVRQ